MPNITLPDGSVRSFEQAVTVAEVAASIGAWLAKAALAGRVDGKMVDLSHRIETDAALAIVTDKGADGLEVVITPTYSGCPAMGQIEDDVNAILQAHGLPGKVFEHLVLAMLSEAPERTLRMTSLA